MTRFDLIPDDYRQLTALRAGCLRTLYGLVAMVVFTLLSVGGLHMWQNDMRTQIELLEQRQQISLAQREQLKNTNDSAAELERQLRLLSGLRGGTPAPLLFKAIDRALIEGDVWFVDWEFLRAGTSVEKVPDDRATGYFIIADVEKESDEAWLIESRMRVQGQAKDHSALSKFVRRLFAQPEIEDIRIVSTTLTSQDGYVEFELKVTVNNGSVQA